jgi:hypothetical protein
MEQPSLLCSLKTSWHSPWLIVELAQLGAMHHAKGQPMADNHIVGSHGDVFWFAVADGVGSEPNSPIGSRTACLAVDQFLQAALKRGTAITESILKEAMAAARSAVERLSITHSQPVATFATTLVIAVVTPDRVYGGSIGDSSLAIFAPDREGRMQVSAFVSAPQPVRIIYSLLTDDWSRVAAFASVATANITGVVAVTDGGNPFITEAHGSRYDFDPRTLTYLDARLKGLTPLRFVNLFAEYLVILPEGENYDDRTMVLAYKPAPNLAPPAPQSG